MWPSGAIDGQLSLDWPRSAIAPRNMVPSLIRIHRIQWCCSLFFVFEWKCLFWANLVSKYQNCHFTLKFGTYTNSNMQNSMMLFSFFVFQWKYPFWANLIQKIKIVTLSWNLVPTLIRICRIQWWCSFFFVFEWKYPFWANLVEKIKIISWSWNLVPALIQICWI